MTDALEAGTLAAEEVIAEDGSSAVEGALADTGTGETETAGETVVEDPEAKARAARVALFEEKLVASRERRQSQRIAERAKAIQKQAAEERKAAEAERAKWDGLKKAGTIKQTLEALGKNPREFMEEANREAIEYSTPEAAAKREQERIDSIVAEQKARIDALEKERTDALRAQQEQAYDANLVTHFTQSLADPAFKNLRIEYPDEVLLDHARHYDKHPRELHKHAKQFGVRLTDPQGRFSMHELLNVLSAAQAAHDAAKQARLAATAPPEAQQAGNPPTVNGTAARRNAGTVTNDLASQRASPGPKVSAGSVKDRLAASIEEEIRRYSGG
jgi:hypothetical protein